MPRLRSAIDVRATDVRNGSAGSAQYSGEAAIEAPVIPNKQVADLEKAAACSTWSWKRKTSDGARRKRTWRPRSAKPRIVIECNLCTCKTKAAEMRAQAALPVHRHDLDRMGGAV